MVRSTRTAARANGETFYGAPAHPNDKLFAATGFTMLGAGDGSNRDATPRFVIFGRASDIAADGQTGRGGGATGSDRENPRQEEGPWGQPPGTPAPSGEPPASGPFTDVNDLPVVNPAVAAQILAAAVAIGNSSQAAAAEAPLRFVSEEAATKPGVERWPVKTGQDPDAGLVGKNVIDGADLGEGIVPATVEELIAINRPPDMRPATSIFPAYQSKRRETVEVTVWQVEGEITVVKLEANGDYHLVITGGGTGDTMIAEVPTPTTQFIGNSPWTDNIKTARAVIDDTFVKQLNPQDFVPVGGQLVPRKAVSRDSRARCRRGCRSRWCQPGGETAIPAFQTKVTPTKVRITGVGFFDADHGQTGVAHLNGIELHPTLKIELL